MPRAFARLANHAPLAKVFFMTPYERRPCPLTIRLAQDLKIRNMAERTIDAYTFHAASM